LFGFYFFVLLIVWAFSFWSFGSKPQKRVSFSQLIKSNKRIKLKHKPDYNGNRIENDSYDEQLVIDFSKREFVPSIINSDDSHDAVLDHSSNKSQNL